MKTIYTKTIGLMIILLFIVTMLTTSIAATVAVSIDKVTGRVVNTLPIIFPTNVTAVRFNGNGIGITNLPVTALNGSGGTGTVVPNGTAGQYLISAGNGGLSWATGGGSTYTNAFDGPTNSLDMSLADQTYVTWTGVSITNILNYSATLSLYSMLTISNAAATNITFMIPDQWRTDDGLRSWQVTNAQVREVYINIKNNMTNCITLPLY